MVPYPEQVLCLLHTSKGLDLPGSLLSSAGAEGRNLTWGLLRGCWRGLVSGPGGVSLTTLGRVAPLVCTWLSVGIPGR